MKQTTDICPLYQPCPNIKTNLCISAYEFCMAYKLWEEEINEIENPAKIKNGLERFLSKYPDWDTSEFFGRRI